MTLIILSDFHQDFILFLTSLFLCLSAYH